MGPCPGLVRGGSGSTRGLRLVHNQALSGIETVPETRRRGVAEQTAERLDWRALRFGEWLLGIPGVGPRRERRHAWASPSEIRKGARILFLGTTAEAWR